MEQEPNTYYPGDVVRLTLEIEHLPNFRRVEAVFRGRSGREDDRQPSGMFYTEYVNVHQMSRDGTKISIVRVEIVADGDKFIPGVVYELDELRGETVGELPGKSLRGSVIAFDLSGIDKPRFRFEAEAGAGSVAVRSVRLE